MIFAANWKMHHGPAAGRELARAVLARLRPREGRTLLFFPPAVSLAAVAAELAGRRDAAAGAQNIHHEPKGAFTGETSAPLAKEAGARWVLVGHSERRHVFGETDADTAKKLRAALAAGLTPLLCLGEKLDEREAGRTEQVVLRQIEAAFAGLDGASVALAAIAYEPVWAIGTGRNATPQDAAAVHRAIRAWLGAHTPSGTTHQILYGGSVNPKNAASLLAEPEINGVLVGGASLEVESWVGVVEAG